MDIISFSEAATANSRIEIINANPDSSSGIVTVPKTIASGETITIPAGRVAVLPNVQIDGVLNVEGEVFIPSGATLGGVVEKVTSTDNAIVRFNGTTGEVQNSGVIIDDNNNVGIGVIPSAWGSSWKSLDLLSSSVTSYTTLTDPYTVLSNNAYISGSSSTLSSVYKNNGSANSYTQGGGAHFWKIAPSGTAGNAITWTTAMTLDTNCNLLLTAGTGALGYGAGAGGTVTQLTSKSTAVTLNKPSGEIVMNNSALAAGAIVEFSLNNSVISPLDLVVPVLNYSTLYTINTATVGNGACSFVVQNRYSISLSEPVKFKFFVVKGATA